MKCKSVKALKLSPRIRLYLRNSKSEEGVVYGKGQEHRNLGKGRPMTKVKNPETEELVKAYLARYCAYICN